MINIYTRLIELGIIFITGITILAINEIKTSTEFRKSEKAWIEHSFEYNGTRYSKKYFWISSNGKLMHRL